MARLIVEEGLEARQGTQVLCGPAEDGGHRRQTPSHRIPNSSIQ
jgi:hypothetical protein